MSEEKQEEVTPVILTLDDEEYDVNELETEAQVHYIEVVNLRNQIGEIQNNIGAAQRQLVNLQVVLGFRETSLRTAIKPVEEAEEVKEAIN